MDPIYTCTHIHLTTHVYTHAHVLVSYVYERSVYVCNTYMHTHTSKHTCRHTHTRTRLYVYERSVYGSNTYMNTQMHACIHTCTNGSVCHVIYNIEQCLSLSLCVCMCLRVYNCVLVTLSLSRSFFCLLPPLSLTHTRSHSLSHTHRWRALRGQCRSVKV